jgi:hypothetical protein
MEFCHLFNQHPVCFSKGEILGNSAEHAVDRSGNGIGNRIEGTSLEFIVVKKQNQRKSLQKQEKKIEIVLPEK